MQIRRVQLTPKPARRGFTLIELLVVISIIATLMALILPAIQAARAAARRTECQNNMKNIALAAHNFASAKKGALPPLGVYGPDSAAAGAINPLHSWVVKLLPFMEARAVYDRWQLDQGWDSSANALVNRTYLKVLACPDDETASAVGGGLSYVANHGYLLETLNNNIWVEPGIDWNGNTFASASSAADLDPADSDAQRDTGVFWMDISHAPYPNAAGNTRARAQQKNSISIEGAYDGGGQSIMFTENTWAGGETSWASPVWTNVGFVLSLSTASGQSYANPLWTTNPSPGKTAPKTLINQAPAGPEASLLNLDTKLSASPNSGHTGGVNVAWVGGSVGFISQDIDSNVYARLVSPAGSKLRTFPTQPPLGDNLF